MTTENYTELALIGIKADRDGSELQFAGMTEDITGIEFGEKDFEGKPLLNGGRVKKRTPMTDETITMKVVPIGVRRDGDGIAAHFAGTAAVDGSGSSSVLNTNLHENHRIVIVVSEELPATASAAGVVDADTYRLTIANAEMIKATPDFSDKDFTAEIMFKWTPFKKDGTSNKKEESGTSLSAVTATPTDVTAT